MKMFFAVVSAALLTIALGSPTFAASKHRNQVRNDSARAYGAARAGAYAYEAPRGGFVTFGNRVIGQDPDPNIRSQMLRDPFPGNY
jgi:hypothetical protein